MIEELPEFEGQQEEILQPESILQHEDKVLKSGKIVRQYINIVLLKMSGGFKPHG